MFNFRTNHAGSNPAAMFPTSPPLSLSRPICLLTALLLTACASTRAPLFASEFDADRKIALRVGQSLVITLPADRSTGQVWMLTQLTLESLALDGEPTYMQESGTAAAGSETWRFRAVRAGLDELRFEYRRPQERGVPAARAIRYTVTAQ